MLYIFSTSRQVREFYSTFSDTLMPKALSIGEFEKKAVYVPNLVSANEDTRVLLMRQACEFENFKKLHIPREFLAFLSNSSYLFRFFEELSNEKKDISDLIGADVYAEFDEHLEILQTLREKYITLLEAHGFYDTITLPWKYELNEDFIRSQKEITLYVEGFLNAYEFELFEKISSLIKVNIHLHLNPYNSKMKKQFLDFGIELPDEGEVEINLNEKTFTHKKADVSAQNATYKSFSLRSLQIGYIFEKIKSFIDLGLKPEEMVVVLPDESFATLLKTYDRANNLNFAMGFSFAQTKAYQKLSAILEFIKEDIPKNRALLKRFDAEALCDEFRKNWKKQVEFDGFNTLLQSCELGLKSVQKKVFENELFHIKIILQQIKLDLSQTLKLFLQRLSKVSLDDTSGGKVVVMGVLETRGMRYKGVIIPDFNDEFIPHFSQKDMFLSSALRVHANLPAQKDREDLQRYYYERIISSAELVAISFTENESSIQSRFLQSIKAKKDDEFSEDSYASALFEVKQEHTPLILQDLVVPNNIFAKPISSSRLKIFLSCKRGYYLRYIEGLQEEQIPDDLLNANDVGNFLHESLKELYLQNKPFRDVKTLHHELCALIDAKKHKKVLWQLQKEFWKEKLYNFCENEIKHFENGWRPFKFEQNFEATFRDVKIHGRIDRIDKNQNGEFCVLDYKSGKVNVVGEKKIDEMDDFQLQFYHILVSQNEGEVAMSGFYDLQKGQIIEEYLMQEKLNRLGEIFEEIKAQKEINFALDEKDCPYSPYDILLGRT